MSNGTNEKKLRRNEMKRNEIWMNEWKNEMLAVRSQEMAFMIIVSDFATFSTYYLGHQVMATQWLNSMLKHSWSTVEAEAIHKVPCPSDVTLIGMNGG